MLKDSQIAKDVLIAEKLIKKAEDSLKKIDTMIAQDNKEGLLEELFNYENLCEKIVNNGRLLPIMSGRNAKDIINNTIIEENNLNIEYTQEGWFYVKIPSLLPKKEKGDPSYIRTTLNVGMKDFFSKNEKKKFESNVVMIFKHNYSKERTYREYRDHDNIELNSVVDMIALYVLIDDSPMKAKHFYCSAIEDTDSTEVFIIPQTDLKKWLTKYNMG